MEYTYNIINDVYYWMLSSKKTIEVRLLKEKSEKIKINDYIIFNNQDKKGKYVKTKIISKNIYDNVEELLKDNDVDKMMPNHSKEEFIKLLNEIYGNNLINKKLVAFEFELLDTDLDIELTEYKTPYVKK